MTAATLSDVEFEAHVQTALADRDDDCDGYWAVVGLLRDIGDDGVFKQVCELCASSEAVRRELGVDILAQLDGDHRVTHSLARRQETIALVAALMATETDVGVLSSCGSAFGHLKGHGNPASLLAHRHHSDPRVREKVAIGIKPTNDAGIDALLELSRDHVSIVREWPLLWFSDPKIAAVARVKQRLVEALNDPDLTCRAEAACGLASLNSPGLRDWLAREICDAPADADVYGLGRLDDAVELLAAHGSDHVIAGRS